MQKKLYKSTEDKKLFGVCGGIAEYFNIDPTIVRVIVVLLCLAYGTGVLVYIVCGLVFPVKPEFRPDPEKYVDPQDVEYTVYEEKSGDDNENW